MATPCRALAALLLSLLAPVACVRTYEGCHGDARCNETCARAEREGNFDECRIMQDVTYDLKHGPAESQSPQSAGSDDAASSTSVRVFAPSAGPLTPAAIAAAAMHAIVVVKAGPAMGTGFGVTERGWIATNLHVVAGASDITVQTGDGVERKVSSVLRFNAQHDIALLEAEGLRAALPLGDSDAVTVGEAVVAIGHPLGLAATVSDGLVSAVRELDPGARILQITAPIAPGSSGGPLIDVHGQVIGLVVATVRGGQNLNFAVPSSYLAQMIREATDDAKPMKLPDFAAATQSYQHRRAPAASPEDAARAAALFAGCTDADRTLAARLLREALGAGAPLCDQGKPGPCYQLFNGAALDVEGKLSPACKGPRGALQGGRTTAALLPDTGAQARALRAVLEGVLTAASAPAGEAGAKP